MMKQIASLALPFAVALGCSKAPVSSTTKEAWDAANDPLHLASNYERRISALPTSGQAARAPWSDTYWPTTDGGVAARWQLGGNDVTNYTPPTYADIQTWTLAQRALLSPAEKYDVYLGRYDYPLVAEERQRTAGQHEGWEGLCHGWAPAALAFDEPKSVVLTGAGGVQIPFAASDIKALLILVQAQYANVPAYSAGARCNIDLNGRPDLASNPECRDVNAGTFHIVLANQLGLAHQGFVADVTRDVQVWNQPISGFSSQFLGYVATQPGAAPGTVREAAYQTTMTYGSETSPHWNGIVGTSSNSFDARTYRYRVELDASDNIIGGEWDESDRPDFLWTMGQAQFTGFFAQVRQIYDASLQYGPTPNPNGGN